MEKLEYTLRLAQKVMPSLRYLELDLTKLEVVDNPNVREVALRARDIKKRMDVDPSYEIRGTYSEAYSGES